MLVIRFLRIGKKNQPFFRIVVAEKKKSAKSGRFIEMVGFFNPLTKENKLDEERIKYWLSNGAKPSDRVFNLLVGKKIVEGEKIPVHKKSKNQQEMTSMKEESINQEKDATVEQKQQIQEQ
jgi:small subunit ribosomal protein S16